MGRIANKHLAKLWDFMANYNYNSDEYPCDILEAFLECDEALSELQDQCDHWKTMYGNACGDQDVLKESIRLLDTENRKLEQKVRDQEKEIVQRRKEAHGLYKELDQLRDEKGSLSYQKIRDQEKEINQLRTENDDLKKQCEDLRKPYIDAIRANNKTIDQLKKEHDELKKDCAYMTNSRDTWRTRAKHAEKEVEELNEQVEAQRHVIDDFVTKVDELLKDRDRKAEAVVELAKKRDELQEALDNIRAELEAKVKRMDEITSDRVKLSEENRKLKARTDCLRMEVEWYRKHYKEQSDKIKELKKQLDELASTYQKLTIENKRLQNNVRNGYDQGQTDLWVALQNVNESQPFELATCFPDVTGMEDIISWDLEDFLDAYKSWQETNEQKRIKYMRDYVERFCIGRLCTRCPLHADGLTCGRNKWLFGVPDKDVKKYYEKARSCGAYNLKDGKLFIHDLSHPMAGVNEAIKNACDRFTKPVEAANINISTSAWHGDATAEKIKIEPWSCTLEGTINVEFDRDLLEKVCGVKPDDK